MPMATRSWRPGRGRAVGSPSRATAPAPLLLLPGHVLGLMPAKGWPEQPGWTPTIQLRRPSPLCAAGRSDLAYRSHEALQSKNLAPEVRGILRNPPDFLVYRPQVGERDCLLQERSRQWRVLDLGPCSLDAVGDDQRVIKGELRALAAAQLAHRPTAGPGGVRTCCRGRHGWRGCAGGGGDHTHPRVGTRATVGAKLLQVHSGRQLR